ncbi:MAG: helix-turn-helix transcriptional regulator [Polyangiaceae bacterium]
MGMIEVVEAAYVPTHDTRTWLNSVVTHAAPLLDRGQGSFALVVESMSAKGVELGEFVTSGCPASVREFVEQVTAGGLSEEDFRRTYGSPGVFDSLSGRAGAAYSPDHWMFKAFRERFGAPDFDLLRAADPSGFCCLMAAARPAVSTPSKREKARWHRIAAHLVAGLRVHRSMRDEPRDAPLLERPPVEAVLNPDGGIVDARGAAKPRTARTELRQAAATMDRARGSLRQRDPDAGLRAWQALVAGRWTLVDVFDTDGRRFIVARENQPVAPSVVHLTRREQHVITYARLGWPSKQIAYTLGIAESTVSETLRRALDKMGLRSRVDLIRSGGGLW